MTVNCLVPGFSDGTGAPSGATSSTTPSSTCEQRLHAQVLEWSDKGGDASSVASSKVGDPRTDQATTRAATQRPTKRPYVGKGRRPEDRPCILGVESLSCGEMATTCLPGRLATETAIPNASASSALLDLSVGGAHSDGFSSTSPERPDQFPSSADLRREGLPEGGIFTVFSRS